MPVDSLRFICPPSYSSAPGSLSRQMARAWPDGSPAENRSLVEDDQHSSSQDTNSDEEIESIVSGSNQPQIPEAILSISSPETELLPESSTPELHDGNSPKRQKVIILIGMQFDDANAINRVVYTDSCSRSNES
jgi:hypothetical protein